MVRGGGGERLRDSGLDGLRRDGFVVEPPDRPAQQLCLAAPERKRYLRQMTTALARNARTPLGLPGAVRAIIASGDYTPMLEAMRENEVPTIVVHGENDLVVPFESAQDMADRADGTLYKVPGAYHSWMLANPRHGADMMRQLLAAELGDVLREAARAHGARGWQDALLTEDSPLRSLEDRPVDAVGVEALDHVEMARPSARQTPCALVQRLAPQTCLGVNGHYCRHCFATGLASPPSDRIGHGARSRRG